MKNVKVVLLSTLFFCSHNLHGIDGFRFLNGRAYGMGQANTTLPGFENPASESFHPTQYVSLSVENRFQLKELNTYAATLNYPNPYLHAGFHISRFGSTLYHETLVSMQVYRPLSSHVSFGIRANYFSVGYEDNSTTPSVFTADLGLLAQLTEKTRLSLLAINPLKSTLPVEQEKKELPTRYLLGASYQLAQSTLLVAEVEQELKHDFRYKMGAEYELIEQLKIRMGLFSAPFTPTMGVGVILKPIDIDVAFSKHATLGIQSLCTLFIHF